METPPDTKWPSIDEAKPMEQGGPIARIGFNYQDDIAVGFLIEMLDDPAIIKIHCETHDDIVIVRVEGVDIIVAEYAQVKAGEDNKLWSIADLCQRKKKTAVGTSIYEASLNRDKHSESSIFRIITLRPVVSELRPLTFPFGSLSRSPDCGAMAALRAELETRFPGVKSPKGNDASYWLENCRWDERHDENSVRHQNIHGIIRLAQKEGRPILLDHAEVLLDELRIKVKAAADAKWDPDPSKKIISRAALRLWWEGRVHELIEGAKIIAGGKLATKMADANLPEDLIALAVELRRDYAAEKRSPRYLEVDDAARLQRRVQSEVLTLRARLVAGKLDLDGTAFHSHCLERMDDINTERAASSEDHASFLKGCMYDIADRCLLKFVR
ncbi:dsDNA nuclease domain-containing protein [Methylobacterium sp. A54F]